MKITIKAFASLAATAVVAASVSLPASADDTTLQVKEIGSYYVGGKRISLTGLPDREMTFSPGSPPVKVNQNGEFVAGQMYVHYIRLEKPRAAYPMLMWHGGGLTGANWESKPDRKPGWEMFFLKQGWDVYTSDAVERGRSSWARYPEIYQDAPFFRNEKEAWELFRIGKAYDPDPSKRVAQEGTQFPIESFGEFVKQSVPRWATNDELTQAAYDQYVEQACPCVIVVHSQGGNFAYKAAMKHPDKIKAMVMVEPSGSPDPEKTDFSALMGVPMLWVWGDYTEASPFWSAIVARQEKVRAKLTALGGQADLLMLPQKGIKGNSHMLMMDKNSDQIAGLVNAWLIARGVTR